MGATTGPSNQVLGPTTVAAPPAMLRPAGNMSVASSWERFLSPPRH